MAVLDTILKLFRLGQEGRGGTEAEMLAAVTKARQLMVKHRIMEAEVQAALDATASGQAPRIEVNRYTAYTRKLKQLARYDEIVSFAVAELTDTESILTTRVTMNGTYISQTFLGDARYTALAAQLFLVWLQEVRRHARRTYGSDKWNKDHTSYAIGYATRILDRARTSKKEAAAAVTSHESTALARLDQNTAAAIAEWKKHHGLVTTENKRKVNIAEDAFIHGYIDGASFNMETKVIR